MLKNANLLSGCRSDAASALLKSGYNMEFINNIMYNEFMGIDGF